MSVSLGQHAVVHEKFTEELDALGLGERVECFVGQRDVPGADACQESGGGWAPFPAVDAFGALCVDEEVDESFESQIRGSARFQDAGQIGA